MAPFHSRLTRRNAISNPQVLGPHTVDPLPALLIVYNLHLPALFATRIANLNIPSGSHLLISLKVGIGNCSLASLLDFIDVRRHIRPLLLRWDAKSLLTRVGQILARDCELGGAVVAAGLRGLVPGKGCACVLSALIDTACDVVGPGWAFRCLTDGCCAVDGGEVKETVFAVIALGGGGENEREEGQQIGGRRMHDGSQLKLMTCLGIGLCNMVLRRWRRIWSRSEETENCRLLIDNGRIVD